MAVRTLRTGITMNPERTGPLFGQDGGGGFVRPQPVSYKLLNETQHANLLFSYAYIPHIVLISVSLNLRSCH